MISSSPALIQHVTAPTLKTLDLTVATTEKLMAFSEGQRPRYINALPFPHIIIDNLFSHELLESVRQDVQTLTASPSAASRAMGSTTRYFLLDLCSSRFCLFLESLTGIDGLIPDPHVDDGGVHEMSRGSFLKLHAGVNWHRKLGLERRLNMLIYLNPHWDERWGGQLELWDSDMQNQFVKVPPVFNKTIIFSTTDHAYYGYPTPLECPDDMTQRSLCLNYYSSSRATSHPASHLASRPTPSPPPALGKSTKPNRRKTTPQLPQPVQSVKKSIQKSLPKSLVELYKAGKRSLRG